MGISDAYDSLKRSLGGFWTRYGGQGWSRVRMFAPGARFDYEREAGDLWMNPVVSLGLSWLGDRFPRPIMSVSKVMRNGDHRPLGRHPLTDLWNRPNPFYGRRTLEKVIGLSLKCDGNAYIYKLRNRMGQVKELWWVPHYRILPTWPPDGSAYIDGYRIWTDSVQVVVPPEDIIHIRDGIDPRNERLGLAALKGCVREVCTVNQESGYTSAILRNLGVPGLMIVPKNENLRPDKEAAQSIKERIRDHYTGDNVGDAIVLAGQYEIAQVGFSPEQLMLDKLPQPAISRIAASIGVAAMSLGLPDPGKTYTNIESANRASWGTIVAIQELIDESLLWQLLPEFGGDPHGLAITRDYNHIQELQENLDAVHTRTREDWKAGLTKLNEARELLGFEPDEAGDRYFPGTGADEPELPEVEEGDILAAANEVTPDEEEKPEAEQD